MGLRELPAKRIVLLSGGWIVASLAVLGWQASRALAATGATGSGGVGAVSVGLLELAVIAVGPPLVFGLLWLALRQPALR
jgi:hypothetical protein